PPFFGPSSRIVLSENAIRWHRSDTQSGRVVREPGAATRTKLLVKNPVLVSRAPYARCGSCCSLDSPVITVVPTYRAKMHRPATQQPHSNLTVLRKI
ncbi:AGAP011612-PA, partial [Anopheles gambiae str. PEST]